jgi:hypothetical protein
VERHFRVKNFERFQHFKDRDPIWIKMYRELLSPDDRRYRALSDVAKAHLHHLWLYQSKHYDRTVGAARPFTLEFDDPEWIGDVLNIRDPLRIDELVAGGFLIETSDAGIPLSNQVDITPVQPDPPEKRREETEKEKEPETDNGGDGKEMWTGQHDAFDACAKLWPGRVERAKAWKRFRTRVPKKQWLRFSQSVTNYIDIVEREQREVKHIKHFATFLSDWESYTTEELQQHGERQHKSHGVVAPMES